VSRFVFRIVRRWCGFKGGEKGEEVAFDSTEFTWIASYILTCLVSLPFSPGHT